MLHRRRKRLEEMAEKEASGQSFWTSSFEQSARAKIVLAARKITESLYNGADFLEEARIYILEDEGLFFLDNPNSRAVEDMLRYILTAPDDMMPTVIEALCKAYRSPQLRHSTGGWEASKQFETTVDTVLREHRIQFELIDARMVEFSSRALHVGVVSPTLSLLGGDKKWTSIERAFQDALEELSKGKAGDAITDAGTALQETLVQVGCVGNALGPLIKSAKTNGLLAAHDSPMLDAIDRLMHWVSADRSEKGDAHTSKVPSLDDAWLTVHIVGAIILRLIKQEPRA